MRTLEDNMMRLEEISKEMQAAKSLQEMVQLYEEAQRLSKEIDQQIKEAELIIETLEGEAFHAQLEGEALNETTMDE